MNRILLFLSPLSILLFSFVADGFEPDYDVKKLEGKIVKVSNQYVIQQLNTNNTRYVSEQLPESFKQDGLEVKFWGTVGKSPDGVRLIGFPLKLSKIKALNASGFRLEKKKYRFK